MKFTLYMGKTYTMLTDSGVVITYHVTCNLSGNNTWTGDVSVSGRVTDPDAFYAHDAPSTCGYLCAPNALGTRESVMISSVEQVQS